MPRKRITNEPQSPNLLGFLTGNWLNVLLIFAPISWLIEWFPGLLPQPKLWLFITSALAIIPLAGLISQATEELAVRLGPRLGGFLNATFGNAAELIIAVFALRAGLVEVVKASITGSILGNILLVLGISMFVGGVGREKQTFNRTHAGANAAALFLAMVALIMPAIYELIVYKSLSVNNSTVELLSMLVAGVLLLIYIASVIFAFSKGAGPAAEPFESHPCQLTPLQAIGVLSVATALAAWESELLVSGISVATKALGMTEFFVGVIVVAIIGNAAEHFTAVTMARRNHMDLAMTIATSSGTQIALLLAPVLVFLSLLFGHPLSLVFNAFEVTGLALSVLILSIVSLDGESNWLEGLQLLGVYLVLAIVFYFVPAP